MVMIRLRPPSGIGKVVLGDGSAVIADVNGLVSVDSQWQPSLETAGFSTSIGGTPASLPFTGAASTVQPRRGDSYFDTTVNQELNFDGTAWRKSDGTVRVPSGQVLMNFPMQDGLGTTVGAC